MVQSVLRPGYGIDILEIGVQSPALKYFLLFHDNSGYANAPHCHVIRRLPVAFAADVNSPVYAFVACREHMLRTLC
jgi:hypothetical protein